MRKILRPPVPSMKIRMIVPRVVSSIPREAGDEFDLQEPLCSMLIKQGIAEQILPEPEKKSSKKKSED